MKTRLYRLVVALLAATAAFALIAPACSAAVVVYLDEAGTPTAYERPEAYDPASALELLAAPPSEEETGMKLTSAVPAGTKLIGIHQDAGAAVVNFSADIIGAAPDGAGPAARAGAADGWPGAATRSTVSSRRSNTFAATPGNSVRGQFRPQDA